MIIKSDAFNDGAAIPKKFTCDGEDINPQLQVLNMPEGAVSLALIVDDPDAPAGSANPGWVHWVR